MCDVIVVIGVSVAAVQNERQPRNSAQVRSDQLEAGDFERSLAVSSATVSATHPAFAPAPTHRYLRTLPAEATPKHDPDGIGRLPGDNYYIAGTDWDM